MGVRLNSIAARVARMGAAVLAFLLGLATHIARMGRSAVQLLQNEAVLVALAFFGGLALAAAGIALIYFPAGLIFAGLVLNVCATLYARSIVRRAPRG